HRVEPYGRFGDAAGRSVPLRRVFGQQRTTGRDLCGAVAVSAGPRGCARDRHICAGALAVAAAHPWLWSDPVMRSVLQRIDQVVGAVCKWGVIGCLLGLFFLLLLAVIVRLVPFVTISGYDEIVELLFAWMTFLGALALWREGALYRVTVIESAIGASVPRLLPILIQALMLIFALVMAIKGYEF